MATLGNERKLATLNIEISVAYSKNNENQLKLLKLIRKSKTVAQIPLMQTTTSTIMMITTTTKTVTEPKESQKLFVHPAARSLNYKCQVFIPELPLTDRRLLIHYFHQPQRLSGSNPKRNPTPEFHKNPHMPEFKLINDVESQTSPITEL